MNLSSPFFFGMMASFLAMLYFILMTINPNLPPALVFSLVIGYFAYYVRGGTSGPLKIGLPSIEVGANRGEA